MSWWPWKICLLVFLVHLLESIDRWLLPTLLRPLYLELSLTDTQVGWLGTLLLLGYALWSPIVGYLADRLFSRPRLMALGIAVWGLATVGTGLAHSYIGAVPKALPGHDPENLIAALLLVVPALLVAGAVLLAGARHLPREMALMLAKLRAAPQRARGANMPFGRSVAAPPEL